MNFCDNIDFKDKEYQVKLKGNMFLKTGALIFAAALLLIIPLKSLQADTQNPPVSPPEPILQARPLPSGLQPPQQDDQLIMAEKVFDPATVNRITTGITQFMPYGIGFAFIYAASFFGVRGYKRFLKRRIMELRLKRYARRTAKKMLKAQSLTMEQYNWDRTKQKIDTLLREDISNLKIQSLLQKQNELQHEMTALIEHIESGTFNND